MCQCINNCACPEILYLLTSACMYGVCVCVCIAVVGVSANLSSVVIWSFAPHALFSNLCQKVNVCSKNMYRRLCVCVWVWVCVCQGRSITPSDMVILPPPLTPTPDQHNSHNLMQDAGRHGDDKCVICIPAVI